MLRSRKHLSLHFSKSKGIQRITRSSQTLELLSFRCFFFWGGRLLCSSYLPGTWMALGVASPTDLQSPTIETPEKWGGFTWQKSGKQTKILLPGVSKGCFLEALKYLKTSKKHPGIETPGRSLLLHSSGGCFFLWTSPGAFPGSSKMAFQRLPTGPLELVVSIRPWRMKMLHSLT